MDLLYLLSLSPWLSKSLSLSLQVSSVFPCSWVLVPLVCVWGGLCPPLSLGLVFPFPWVWWVCVPFSWTLSLPLSLFLDPPHCVALGSFFVSLLLSLSLSVVFIHFSDSVLLLLHSPV